MPTKVEIVNLGLAHLGARQIASFDDDSEEARLARTTYDSLLDAVLTEFPWNFAVERRTVSKAPATVAWGDLAAFPMDADDLRILGIQGGEHDLDFGVESIDGVPYIVTNHEDPLNYVAIRRITDASRYSPLFVQALAARIAMEWTQALGRGQELLSRMAELYSSKLRLARQVDSQERTPQQMQAFEWIDAHERGDSPRRARLSGPPQPLGY